VTKAVSAIIFSPADTPLDIVEAERSLAHAKRRGYFLLAIVREESVLEELLVSKAAQVVIFAYRARRCAGPFVDDPTSLNPMLPPSVRFRTHRRLPLMSRERVRSILTDGEATRPVGIDPETIAAARRIARSLAAGASPIVQDQGCN
jgi:hypothetical protein